MPRHCKSTYSDNRVDTASALINIYFNDNRICKLQFYHTKLCIVSPCITPDNDIYYNIELQNRRIIYLYIRLGDIDSAIRFIPQHFILERLILSRTFFNPFFLIAIILLIFYTLLYYLYSILLTYL